MFLANFNTFHRWSVGVFQTDISNSHCGDFAIQAGFGTTIYTVVSQSSAFLTFHEQEKLRCSFAQRHDKKSLNEQCMTYVGWHNFLCKSSSPEDPDKPIKLVTRGWCLSCRSFLHQLGANTAGYRSVSFCICPHNPEERPTAGTRCSVW